VVECKNSQCQIAIQTFGLHKNSHDFETISKQIMIDVFECREYGEYGEKYRELTRYARTSYTYYDPLHLVEWVF
jgi:hypothetical protein